MKGYVYFWQCYTEVRFSWDKCTRTTIVIAAKIKRSNDELPYIMLA